MKTVEEIISLYKERRSGMDPVVRMMEKVRDVYNGGIVIPLPSLERNELSAIANTIQSGLDGTAQRIASVMPNLDYPPVKDTKIAKQAASKRRRANLGWWESNEIGLQLGQRARYLIGYASSPVIIRPDWKRHIPQWQIRDPLSCYPAATLNPTDMTPSNVIFSMTRQWWWLRDTYGSEMPGLQRHLGNPKPDARFTLLEYVDGDEYVLILLSKDAKNSVGGSFAPFQLERYDNKAGVCTAIVPGRITLDRPQGQYDQVLGPMYWQARLQALELIAVEKGIFPETFLIARQNETPRFLNGPHPPMSGLINVIEGGDIKEIQTNPGFQTNPTIDRMERNARVTSGTPSEYGGESPTNIRTGKRGDAVLSAVVDPTVAEAQNILASSLMHENRAAVATVKAYFGNESKSFYVNWKGGKGAVDYTPNVDFDTDNNSVRFPHPGTDANGLAIAMGQRNGMGILSKRSMMEMDPFVEDAEVEHDRVQTEGLEAALMASIQQQAASGQIPPHAMARIMTLVSTNRLELAEAVDKVHKEMQQNQAPGVNPVDPNSPQAQPGLAQPGAGAEAGIQPPAPSQQNLADLLQTLRTPQRTTPSERVA